MYSSQSIDRVAVLYVSNRHRENESRYEEKFKQSGLRCVPKESCAVVQADTVKAEVGGDLRIESLQDTSTYRESSQQVGGSVTFGVGAGGSVSISKNRTASN